MMQWKTFYRCCLVVVVVAGAGGAWPLAAGVGAAVGRPAAAAAQGQGQGQGQVSGEVTEVDAAARRVAIKTAQGEVVTVQFDASSSIKRVPPGATSLAQAAPITFQEIAVGDRLLAAGLLSEDRKSVAARQALVVSRDELAQKVERDKAEWSRRGIIGSVLGVDAEGRTLKAQVRGTGGAQPLTLTFTDASRLRRYAADSVAYKDTAPSTFEQIKVGDTFRALGNRSEDGASYRVEEILVGTFRVIPATVVAVEAGSNEVKVRQLGRQETITVVTNKDTRTRRLSKELAAALAGGQGDLQPQVEAMPPVNLGELKAGDMLLLTVTAGEDQSRATAIALIAGVEPALRPLQAQLSANSRQPNYKLGLPEGLSSLGVSLP
ncbi:MAG TPA: hypothetical protein VEY09_17155 [Pyrinomonadaceae bacterium]|nr:hypothetical protein [Pyrinomonadaceae bacterium]